MNFAYEGTEVKGFNRVGTGSELTGKCTPQDLVWGMNTEYYTASAKGKLIAKTQAEIGLIKATNDKDITYSRIIKDIDRLKATKNAVAFSYNSNSYLSDKESIQAVQNQCLTMVDTDPIPTFAGTDYAGMWHIDTGFIPFTVGEFKEFATAYYLRTSGNFTVASVHKMSLAALHEDPSKTAEDLLAYDFSGGWH